MLMTVTFINTVHAIPVSLADTEMQNKKLSDALMFGRFGSTHFLMNRQADDDNIDDDEILYQKRQLKKKWARFHQGAQSPYTIAFPALIRSRREIE
jgi:hypothetical protein